MKERLKKILEYQEEVLTNVPNEGLLLRDIGSWGPFYQCGNCRLVIKDYLGAPREYECSDCGNGFCDKDNGFKIFDVTKLLGIEYEWEDLNELGNLSFVPWHLTIDDPEQSKLDDYN